MTRDQLVNSFMRLGTADKITAPYSRIFKRKKAGRKGIGRIASQRLGDQLIVRTKADGHPAYELLIDWNKIESSIDLFTLSFPIREINMSFPIRYIDGKQVESGTLLEVKKLSNEWTRKEIRGIYKYIADLLQPDFINNALRNDDVDYSVDSIELNNSIESTE